MSKGIFAVWMAASMSAWAAPSMTRGKVEIVGKGVATAAPELATVTTTVVVACRDSAPEAKNAVEAAGARVAKALEMYRRIERDKVLTHTENPRRKTETAPDGRRSCENGWHAEQTLTLHFAQLSLLGELQIELLALATEIPTADASKQTYLVLGQPSFHLSEETYSRLKRESQEQAWADARAQFDGFDRRCKFNSARLSDSAKPDWNAFSQTFAGDSGSKAVAAPDEILVEAVWKFGWTFAGSNCPKEASQVSP